MREAIRQITDLQDLRNLMSESDVLCARLQKIANALLLKINGKLIMTSNALLSLKLLKLLQILWRCRSI
jgi:hypothetical protein